MYRNQRKGRFLVGRVGCQGSALPVVQQGRHPKNHSGERRAEALSPKALLASLRRTAGRAPSRFSLLHWGCWPIPLRVWSELPVISNSPLSAPTFSSPTIWPPGLEPDHWPLVFSLEASLRIPEALFPFGKKLPGRCLGVPVSVA